MKTLALVSGILLCSAAGPSVSHADTEAAPYPWLTVSSSRNFVFKMVPAKTRWDGERSVVEREPYGVAYKLEHDGNLKEIWRTRGWYAFDAHLSRDGRFLVRYGPWARDRKQRTDLAIAFYDRGVLVKQYRVKDLIRDPRLLEYSAGHYRWRAAVQTEPNGIQGNEVHLVLIDRTKYRFNLKTGEIVGVGRDEAARGFLAKFLEEEERDAKDDD